jgi:hypothetical protein
MSSPTSKDGPTVSLASASERFIQCAKEHGASIPSNFNPKTKADLYQLSDAVNAACDRILQAAQPPWSDTERQVWLRYAQCMRQKGIPTNDPQFTAGAVAISFGRGVSFESAAYQTANKACGGGIQPTPQGS